jgi:hypothetical protein
MWRLQTHRPLAAVESKLLDMLPHCDGRLASSCQGHSAPEAEQGVSIGSSELGRHHVSSVLLRPGGLLRGCVRKECTPLVLVSFW